MRFRHFFVLACAISCVRTSDPPPRGLATAPPPTTAPTPKTQHVELLPARVEDGDLASTVKRELVRARSDGKDLLVYVGATWCEPCQRFHRAAAAGLLDARFPRLRLLEFDADRDAEPLATAGYVSRLIPLFARPGPDGRSSGRQIEGSIKGEGAVDQIAPRLADLVKP
jgi:hypothetical protein